MKPYPDLGAGTLSDTVRVLLVICRERKYDIEDFENLNNIFVGGRIVGKVPTGANDVDPTDRVGDTNFDYASGYMYRLVGNAGTAVWARVALDTGW